ncbi:MAG: asparagine synthase (glutamine-hydrolyzing) [Gemmatimonadota bacterium]|nr:asparagine synthase (glutamine-hydrolyzing) [Gemmatimonadota bacterium]
MCGICGIVIPTRSRRTLDAQLLTRMRDQLRHRGPDDAGLFVQPHVGLGHRRLSIVDVAGGHQPMASADGTLQIVYNGEVFNHPDLKAQLEAQGVRYHTRCDTETVLHLYEREGRSVPRRLRGMFAFAIWNGSRRELFLARDRFGVKPLYYVATDDGALYFASEIKALLEVGVVAPSLDLGQLPDYLANHAPSGNETLFEGVRRLPPGHTLLWRDGETVIEPYWDLSFASHDSGALSERALVEEYRERFREAVWLRLMSDVPLGVFLSGGIDSAAITATMSGLVDQPIKTFSVAFAEREANELGYARLVAERYRTDHHETVVSPEDFFSAVPRLVWHEDEPMAHPSSVALNFVSRLAADHVKVVLTGEGSDETLAGYGRYRTTLYNLAFGQRYQRVLPVAVRRAVRERIEALGLDSRARRKLIRTFLALPADLDALYYDNFAVFSRARQRELLASPVRETLAGVDPYAAAHRALERCDSPALLDRLLYADTKTYLHELLMKQDQMSMAASIESRVPFLDHPLVEFVARLPERMKLRGMTTKYILRRAMRDALPAEILSRRKMGFPVPIGSWFRGAFAPVMEEFVCGQRAAARGLLDAGYLRRLVAEHRAGEGNHAERLWSLVNLEVWHRIFIDRESPDDVSVAMVRAPARGGAVRAVRGGMAVSAVPEPRP